jgi:hypothetical protein
MLIHRFYSHAGRRGSGGKYEDLIPRLGAAGTVVRCQCKHGSTTRMQVCGGVIQLRVSLLLGYSDVEGTWPCTPRAKDICSASVCGTTYLRFSSDSLWVQ